MVAENTNFTKIIGPGNTHFNVTATNYTTTMEIRVERTRALLQEHLVEMQRELTLKMKRRRISVSVVSFHPRLANGDPHAALLVKSLSQLVEVSPEPQRHYPRVGVRKLHARVVVGDQLCPKPAGAAQYLQANRMAFDRFGSVRIALVKLEGIRHRSVGEREISVVVRLRAAAEKICVEES